MAKPFKRWTVLPHGRLRRLDENLLSVVGEMRVPLGELPRRMTVVRLSDERLVIFNAIALDEDEMAALDEYGVVAYLIVPNDVHRMDVKIWKDRYPNAAVVTPPGARDAVEKLVPVDFTDADFGDPHVKYVNVPGTKEREAALEVKTESGTTLVVNDLIWNLEDRPGVGGWMFHALGMTGDDAQVPKLFELRNVDDKRALAAQLEAWSRIPDLNRIVVMHGKIVARDVDGVLVELAEELAA